MINVSSLKRATKRVQSKLLHKQRPTLCANPDKYRLGRGIRCRLRSGVSWRSNSSARTLQSITCSSLDCSQTDHSRDGQDKFGARDRELKPPCGTKLVERHESEHKALDPNRFGITCLSHTPARTVDVTSGLALNACLSALYDACEKSNLEQVQSNIESISEELIGGSC